MWIERVPSFELGTAVDALQMPTPSPTDRQQRDVAADDHFGAHIH